MVELESRAVDYEQIKEGSVEPGEGGAGGGWSGRGGGCGSVVGISR